MNLRTESNFVLYNINRWAFVTEVDSVYCGVRDEYLYNTDTYIIQILI